MDKNKSAELTNHLLADVVVETDEYWELIRLTADNHGKFLHYLGGYVYRAGCNIYFKAHDMFVLKDGRFRYTLSGPGPLDPAGTVAQTFTVELVHAR